MFKKAYPEDYSQTRQQGVRDSFLHAVENGSTTVEQVTRFRDHLQESNGGLVTPTLAGVSEALTILQPQQ